MRGKHCATLLGITLAAALTGVPAVSAASTAGAPTSIQTVTQDPAPQTDRQKRLYNKGYEKGIFNGRLACERGTSYSIDPTGVKWYDQGYRHGYSRGFTTCERPVTPKPS
ncbi:hypothetical protein ACFXJ8_13655 [Nonomuraea sp. NPDC059194]|uniref:hypothetical protein n=1 Tax=Nonomuraea sp. NPDC059194 TaxID=3346764 RepID=UPI0036AE1708